MSDFTKKNFFSENGNGSVPSKPKSGKKSNLQFFLAIISKDFFSFLAHRDSDVSHPSKNTSVERPEDRDSSRSEPPKSDHDITVSQNIQKSLPQKG